MTTETAQPGLARRLGLFDATMIVMGGIIGSGIFVNPAAVARHVGTPGLIVGAWLIGGAIALVGALVYAEPAARRPETGGQYAYLRDAWGRSRPSSTAGRCCWSSSRAAWRRWRPSWRPISATWWRCRHPEAAVAAAALALLTLVNCLGVRAGSNVQNALMVLKIGVIVAVVAAGLLLAGRARGARGARAARRSG